MITNIFVNDTQYSCVLCTIDKCVLSTQTDAYKPKEGSQWSGQTFFLEKLKYLERSNIVHTNKVSTKCREMKCILCGKVYTSHKIFTFKTFMWDTGLAHYVAVHNVKPPSKFIRFVLNNEPTNVFNCKKSFVTIKGKIKKLDKFGYVKIKANQLMIIDALMEHGGIKPKYMEKHETGYKYSEHAGMLEFDTNSLKRVVVSGVTQRTSNDDPEIFFPTMGEAAYDYEYIFHTHPATPSAGGRVEQGILYEFPSSNDVYHFIEHFNHGLTQGSLVITPEGLYNIRKYEFDKKKLPVDTSMGIKLRQLNRKIQQTAIAKFKKNFDAEYFHSIIAQDMSAINDVNKLLKKYGIWIDYYPRQKTRSGDWIIGTIYLPLCRA